MARFKDLTGEVFGRFTILSEAPKRKSQRYWVCRCECGNIRTVLAPNLRRGLSRSCGCLASEMTTKRCKIHGESHSMGRSHLYVVWTNLKARCENTNCRSYADYGARGIYVCEEWKKSYTAFKDWATQTGHVPGLQIDRIDNDGPYSPDNCRWVTPQENARNKRNNIWVDVNGERLSTQDIFNRYGIKPGTLRERIRKKGDAARLLDPVKNIPAIAK